MSNDESPMNRWALTEVEATSLREFVTAVVLNGQVTAEAAGLRATDLYVLNLLDIDGESTPGELAKRTALTTGAITKLIDRLARIGLVSRTPDATDRRKIRLSIIDRGTDEALGSSADVFSPMARRMDELISSYPSESRATIFDFFAKATETLHGATAEMQLDRSAARLKRV